MDPVDQKNNSTNKLRRSVRLQELGYYRPDGKPTINYRKKLYREQNHKPVEIQRFYEAEIYRPLRTLHLPFCLILIMILIFTMNHLSIGPETLPATEEAPLENFALLSHQATVLRLRSSSLYNPNRLMQMVQWLLCSKHLFVMQTNSPLVAGDCWPFQGNRGHLHIKLSQDIHITHVTLGHITKAQSPTGETTSAPKYFSVYGKKTLDGKEHLLGQFFYNNDGPDFQAFPIAKQNRGNFRHVRLQVESNWGNTEYTCLYNFKVHGKPADPANQPPTCSKDHLEC